MGLKKVNFSELFFAGRDSEIWLTPLCRKDLTKKVGVINTLIVASLIALYIPVLSIMIFDNKDSVELFLFPIFIAVGFSLLISLRMMAVNSFVFLSPSEIKKNSG